MRIIRLKKFFSLLCILLVSLLCTACINNLAIQELNQIGKDYLEKGDYEAAIARFQSSVDLDENLFESRYNLGVAYINNKQYDKAINELKVANNLNPESADAVYSYAVALESEGLKIDDIENEIESDKEVEAGDTKPAEPSITDIEKSINLINSAIKLYERYLTMIDNNEDKEKINAHIQDLKNSIDRLEDNKPGVKLPADDGQ